MPYRPSINEPTLPTVPLRFPESNIRVLSVACKVRMILTGNVDSEAICSKVIILEQCG